MGNMIVLTSVILLLVIISSICLFLVFNQNRIILDFKKQHQDFQVKQEIMQAGIETQEQTLKNISREIHDNVGQVLSLSKVNLGLISLTDKELKSDRFGSTVELLGKAIRDLRDISRRLVDNRVSKHGLRYAIENELNIIKNTCVYDINMKITGDQYPLEEQQEVMLFRILQDALLNETNQTSENDIIIELIYKPGMFSMRIQNKYPGFEADKLAVRSTQTGLSLMQSRTAMIGGKFSLNSTTERGTTISIDLSTPITSKTIE